MKRLLWTTALLLGFFSWFAGRYLNNPVPPNMEEPFIYNLFTGLVTIMVDLSYYSARVGLCEERQCLRHGIAAMGRADMWLGPPYTDGINITDTEFDGVPVRIYRPETNEPTGLSPGLVYVHGGGFMTGTADNYDRVCAGWVKDLGITIVFISYRMAPEFPSPVPLEDCERATRYFFTHAHLYAVDTANIGVAGDSAGGNLGAALTISLRDSGEEVQFKYQILLYPLMQGLDVDLPSFEKNDPTAFFFIKKLSVSGVIGTYLGFWDWIKYAEVIKMGAHVSPEFRKKYEKYVSWKNIPENYISDDFKLHNKIETTEDHVRVLNQLGFSRRDEISHVISKFEAGLADWRNFPLMADDLSNLPPAYVLACEYDTLRDDALLYAQRLEKAGNQVELDYQQQGWHGYLFFAKTVLTCTSAVNVYNNVTQYINTFVT